MYDKLCILYYSIYIFMRKLTENSKNLKTNTNDSSLPFIALIY